MITFSIKELSNIVKGQCIAIDDLEQNIEQISTDSRTIGKNTLFIALIGEKFNGHDFVQQAIESGAVAVLVSKPINSTFPQIIVEDTNLALGEIAHWMRTQSHAKFLALTGSSGKTSVKEMTAAILLHRDKTLFTHGNFNNDIGVPLTLFRISKEDKYAVIELGANHIGEIAYTTKIVNPNIALINNISEAHLEGFGSIDGVAQAKSEIFEGLTETGIAIINLDCYRKEWLGQLQNKTILTFSLTQKNADFYPNSIQYENGLQFILNTPKGCIGIHLPVFGIHNISNAIAASAMAMSAGATLKEIQQGLNSIKAVKGRLYPIKLNDNQLILDDTYNANVDSMIAAIQTLSCQKGYRVLVVGDMAELGKNSEKLHQKIGQEAKIADIDFVISVGISSEMISKFSEKGVHFQDKQDAILLLNSILTEKKNVTILVKGSRSAKMEEIIYGLI